MRDDVPSLRIVPIVREVERTFARGCARAGFRLVHYSLQENHAHLIVEAVATRTALLGGYVGFWLLFWSVAMPTVPPKGHTGVCGTGAVTMAILVGIPFGAARVPC